METLLAHGANTGIPARGMACAMTMRTMTPGVVMSLGAMLLDVMMFVNVSVGVPSVMMRRPCRRRSRNRDDSH
jgi:hypothetical protein